MGHLHQFLLLSDLEEEVGILNSEREELIGAIQRLESVASSEKTEKEKLKQVHSFFEFTISHTGNGELFFITKLHT